MKIKNMKVRDLVKCLNDINPDINIEFEADVYNIDKKISSDVFGVGTGILRLGLVKQEVGTHNAFGIGIQLFVDSNVVDNPEINYSNKLNPTILSVEQIMKAKTWLNEHKKHVDNLVVNATNYYPPTEQEDMNSPNLWKPEHWKWFLEPKL